MTTKTKKTPESRDRPAARLTYATQFPHPEDLARKVYENLRKTTLAGKDGHYKEYGEASDDLLRILKTAFEEAEKNANEKAAAYYEVVQVVENLLKEQGTIDFSVAHLLRTLGLRGSQDSVQKAIAKFETFSPDFRPKGTHEDSPLLSEDYLYELLGKEDARTVLARWGALREAAGLSRWSV